MREVTPLGGGPVGPGLGNCCMHYKIHCINTIVFTGGLRGRTKVVTGAQETPKGSMVDIWGANEVIWPRGPGGP